MTADELVKVFRELGFPAAVAAFVLWRLEARLRELTAAINAMTLRCALATRAEAQPRGRGGEVPPPDPSDPFRP